LLDLIRAGQRDLIDAGGVLGIVYEEADEFTVSVTLAPDA
jgi:hypothetical protein